MDGVDLSALGAGCAFEEEVDGVSRWCCDARPTIRRRLLPDNLISDPVAPEYNAAPTVRKMRRAAEYIGANLAENPELVDIAAAVGMSPYHFARLFKQAMGITPHQYVIAQRITSAQQLLMTSDLPLVEVGLRVGFNTQSHFSTLFRRWTGLTPKQYRQQSAAQRQLHQPPPAIRQRLADAGTSLTWLSEVHP